MGELSGEKIDIIPWSPDPATYIASAISPANVSDIEIFEEEKKAVLEVSPDQLSLAIGKGGQNVRLAAKLTGWRIDIEGAELSETGEIIDENGETVSLENEDEDILDDGIVDDGTEE